VTRLSIEVSTVLTTYMIWAAGLLGIVLVAVGEGWEFSQTWVSIAFVLFLFGVLFAWFVHTPNLKKMEALQAQLVDGRVVTPAGGGAPAEVAELEARGKRAGMYGGILHLVFLLLVIDMIWKPGL
jgi:HAMP domain-containing protein